MELLHNGTGTLLGIELINTNSHHVPSSVLIVEHVLIPFWVLRARPSRLSDFHKEKLFCSLGQELEVTRQNAGLSVPEKSSGSDSITLRDKKLE